MFDNFTIIPHTENEVSATMVTMNEINEKFKEIVPNENYSFRWRGNYILSAIAELLTTISGLTGSPDKKVRTFYYENDDYHFLAKYEETEDSGIVIHEAPSTRFNPANYPTAEYMENAQEFLKQTPHHFLKIFTYNKSNYLYVWTNKALSADTIYKLFALEASFYNPDNELLMNFVNTLIANDITKAKKLLIDFFTSDEILEREFQNFKNCLNNTTRNKILRLETDIKDYRERIQSYENEIASLATQMREWNEKLAFIKYVQADNEDDKLFFKHLKKIPYILSFRGDSAGYIHLEYQAPIVYFSEYPAERLLKQTGRNPNSKDIIKIILGRKYELITKCALSFNTSNFAVNSDTTTNNNSVIPHPHISRYHCFGNHRQAIYDSAEAGDYIGAIEQITQAVLNINFYDVCVIDTLCSLLYEKRNLLKTWRCKETGEMFTTNEVLSRGDYYEKA